MRPLESSLSRNRFRMLTLPPSRRWSTRHDYAQMHYSRRPSSLTSFGDDGVQVVEVTESRSAPPRSEKIPNGMTAYSTFIESRRPSVDSDSPASDNVRAMSALRV